LKRQGGGGESREDVLKKTAAAFDKYEELLAHLQVGRCLKLLQINLSFQLKRRSHQFQSLSVGNTVKNGKDLH